MTPHNHAKPGDYAESVLLPGDPLRAKWIAETFLADARQVNSRAQLPGLYRHLEGQARCACRRPAWASRRSSIYVHELINVYGLKTLIRVGTCGGLNADVKVRDLIIAQGASTDSHHRQGRVRAVQLRADRRFRPAARRGRTRPRRRGLRYHVGNMLSSDIFYHIEPGLAGYGRLPAHGVLGVEMEAAALYTLAARFGRQGAGHLHHDRLPYHP